MTDDDREVLPGLTHPRFRNRTMRIEPGDTRPFDESEWHDSLVVIESGEVELEMISGARHTCQAGDVLWLAGLPLRRLANHNVEPVVITMVRRS